jgi:hypothetical protein
VLPWQRRQQALKSSCNAAPSRLQLSSETYAAYAGPSNIRLSLKLGWMIAFFITVTIGGWDDHWLLVERLFGQLESDRVANVFSLFLI